MFDSSKIKKIGALVSDKHLFPILAFIVPLLVRIIPEILMGPYVIGFDTMGYYVPATFSVLNGSVNLWSLFVSAPLFYALISSIVSIGAPLIIVLKILPLVLHGLLGLSIYAYAKKSLAWSSRKSLLVSLLGTIYFVALRVSWDLLRNELAIIFFFVVLTLLSEEKQHSSLWRRYILPSSMMVAVVLAHQLVSFIMIGVIAFTIAQKLLKKNYVKSINLIVIALPAILLFVFMFFAGEVGYRSFDFSMNMAWPLSDLLSYPTMLASVAGFFLYCYLPLLPLALLSLKHVKNFQLKSWLVLSFILLLIPITGLSNFRWVFMFTYPLAFYVSEGLSRLRLISWKRFRLTLFRVVAIYLVLVVSILSLGLMLRTPETPFAYYDAGPNGFNRYIFQMPSSMLQNTISINDCQDTNKALQWFKSNTDASAILLTHRAFYGWALLNLDKEHIISYEFENPQKSAENATAEGNSNVFLIWWVNGSGWYELPTVPSAFEEVYRNNRIAIYRFNAANNQT